MTRTTRTVSTRPANQGSNWIRRTKRNAIYAADSCECVYCGARVAPGDARGQAPVGVRLATLDHVEPVSAGGSNAIDNLVTACADCNASKGDDDLGAFLARRNRVLLAILASLAPEVSA